MDEKNSWNKSNDWDEELDFLKSIIAKTELVETVKWGAPTYTINNKNVLGVCGFKSYFGLWFHNGSFMKDEQQVFEKLEDGETKFIRQWRFKSKEEINEKLILKYLNEAIANEKAGIKKAPTKKEAIVSDFFEDKLRSDSKLKTAFEVFSPYKQREFLEYIETAKQEKTKISRFEKIKPMILNGVGLNDKYR